MENKPDEMRKVKKLFEEEYAHLEKYEELMQKKSITKDELSGIYLMLVAEHKKLLKDAVKMTIISDRIDKKMLKANDSLQAAHEKIVALERRNSALAMAVTASHELNQPLTVLNGNLELFQRTFHQDSFSEKQKMYLSKIKKSLSQIQGTIDKYHQLKDIHFENYMDERDMVVFEEETIYENQ